MGVSSFSGFEGPDFLAFVACAGIGYFIGTFAPAGAPSIYTSILVAYHLFLGWLIVRTSASNELVGGKAGVSLPIVHTVLTHVACLVVVLGPVAPALHSMPALATPTAAATAEADDPEAALLAEHRTERTLRLIKGVCCSMAALAVFERRWLFSSEASETPKPQTAPQPTAASAVRATGNDTVEWQRYLAAHRQSLPPGTSIKAEYEKWLVARHPDQPPAPPGPAAG